jgi:hypothetical protein
MERLHNPGSLFPHFADASCRLRSFSRAATKQKCMAPERGPLQIQSGSNGPPSEGRRSHAAPARLEAVLHGAGNGRNRDRSRCPTKSPARSPARAHFVSFNFTNAVIRTLASSTNIPRLGESERIDEGRELLKDSPSTSRPCESRDPYSVPSRLAAAYGSRLFGRDDRGGILHIPLTRE